MGLLGPVGWGGTEMCASPEPLAQHLSVGPAVGLSTGMVVGKGGWQALGAVWSRGSGAGGRDGPETGLARFERSLSAYLGFKGLLLNPTHANMLPGSL